MWLSTVKKKAIGNINKNDHKVFYNTEKNIIKYLGSKIDRKYHDIQTGSTTQDT